MIGVAEVAGVREAMGRVAAGFDPAVVMPSDAARIVEHATAIENMTATLKAMAARRAAEGGGWRRSGHRSPAEWLARQTGTTVGQARTQLDTAERLATLPATEAAARSGALSAAQAAAISDAAAADPGAERKLLEVAERQSLRDLRDEAARTKAAADPDPEATWRRLRDRRSLRQYTDAEGAWNLHVRNTAEVGALVQSVLGPLIDEQFTAARLAGRREPLDAYAADAFTELFRRSGAAGTACTAGTTDNIASGDPNGDSRDRSARPRLRHLALLRVDLEALVRGAVEGDELCEITGIGPVPVSVARSLLGESLLKLVITRGRDVATVVHLGRGPSAAQRIALLWSQPLCTNEACPHRAFLEYDHRLPWAQGGATTLDNLDRLCPFDHDLKTRNGWALVAGSGRRAFVSPDDPRHPDFWTNQRTGTDPP